MKTQSVKTLLLINLALLAGCDNHTIMAVRDDDDPIQYDGVDGLNYTPYYTHTFNIKGHSDDGASGGGPNVQSANPDNVPSGGGEETCCASLSRRWCPGLKVAVRWIANRKLDGTAWGAWHKAEARVPEYGTTTYGMWAIFPPGDRVRVMIKDGNANGHNHVRARSIDDNSHIGTETVDEEFTCQDEERHEKQRQTKITQEIELTREAEFSEQHETT